jgi:hypothetical protein
MVGPSRLSPRTFWIVAREFSSFEAARAANRPADSDTGHGSVRPSTRATYGPRFSGSRLQTHGPAGPRGQTGGQHSVVRRLRRLTGTSGKPPIGWPARRPGVHGEGLEGSVGTTVGTNERASKEGVGPQMRRIKGKLIDADRSGALLLLAHNPKARAELLDAPEGMH